MIYWTKAPGTGGKILTEEDFVVTEILSRRMSKFSRTTKGIMPTTGRKSLIRVVKKGMTTGQAVLQLSRMYNMPEDSFSYAGLKDKKAITTQYMTINGIVGNASGTGISSEFIMKTDKKLSKGDLEANMFRITLHDCNASNAETVIRELEKSGMPNYFGPQRFGRLGNNHVIGKMIAEGSPLTLDEINKSESKTFNSLREIPKENLKFYMNAHQSHLFNEMLDKYVKKHRKPAKREFRIMPVSNSDLRITCSGFSRKAFIFPSVSYKKDRGNLILEFTLPKGSYATVLIREITKA